MSDEGTITRPMIETLFARFNSLEASLTEMVTTTVQKAISAATVQLEAQINESRVQLEAQINESRVQLEAQINESRVQLEAQINELRVQLEGLRVQLDTQIESMNDGFAAIRDEITVVADETRTSRANQKRLLRRIEQLEPKVS